jgi:hypothetical protein
MIFLKNSQSSILTSEILYGTDTQASTKDDVMLYLQGFPVNRSPWQGEEKPKMIAGICGPLPLNVYALYDLDSASLKTLEDYYPLATSKKSSKTWLKAGMIVAGVCYQQPNWEQRINEIGSGLLPTPAAQEPGWTVGGTVEVVDKHGNPPEHANQRFYDKNTGRIVQKGLTQVLQMWPTPTVHGNYNRKGASPTSGDGLATALQKFPTPQSTDWKRDGKPHGHDQKDLPRILGGKPNPTWVDWLMGFPIGWTDLKPLATPKFQLWLLKHGNY